MPQYLIEYSIRETELVDADSAEEAKEILKDDIVFETIHIDNVKEIKV